MRISTFIVLAFAVALLAAVATMQLARYAKQTSAGSNEEANPQGGNLSEPDLDGNLSGQNMSGQDGSRMEGWNVRLNKPPDCLIEDIPCA
jgi:hypothetical protein